MKAVKAAFSKSVSWTSMDRNLRDFSNENRL